jgi:hypothetical protein
VREATTSKNINYKGNENSTAKKCEDGNCNSTQTPEFKAVSTDDIRKSTPGEIRGKLRSNGKSMAIFTGRFRRIPWGRVPIPKLITAMASSKKYVRSLFGVP